MSKREHNVMTLLTQGYNNKDIALELGLTLGTVKTHLSNIYVKLGVTGRTHAVVHWHQLQLLGLNEGIPEAIRLAAKERHVYLLNTITLREAEVMELVATGLGNKEIATILGTSENTIKNNIYSTLQKMQVPSRTAAAVLWVTRLRERRGYTDPVQVVLHLPVDVDEGAWWNEAG